MAVRVDRKVAVIGMGYVGLPVALGLAKYYQTIGFDIHQERIQELCRYHDRNGETREEELSVTNLRFTSVAADLAASDFFIIAVPTPVDDAKQPNLNAVLNATTTVGKVLKKGDIVVYESTVYPGLTEEVCLPVLEKASGMKAGVDFKIGYSPERINPGDTQHGFSKIKKIVSAQDEESLGIVSEVYGSAVSAGVFRASSIKVAEAAKVIENTQRDLNIALMNELSIIFARMSIDTQEVLDAAATKWNFLKFVPGLVGGHCIGVDPYYLTYKAEKLGYHPQVILAGRRINDEMGKYVARETIKQMIKVGHPIRGSVVAVLGLAFKENCRDIRNSRVIDIISELQEYGVHVKVCDSLVSKSEANRLYNLELVPLGELSGAHSIIVAVAHDEFRELSLHQLRTMAGDSPLLIDVKGVYSSRQAVSEGFTYWRL